MKHNNAKKWGRFKSGLELYAYTKLTEAGVEFEYEPYKIVLFPAFKTKVISIERQKKKKELIECKQNVLPITYTPDFVGKDWIIETKGRRTPDFDLKWKMFKKVSKKKYLYMPTNQKEVDACIVIINGLHKRILLESENLKLTTRSNSKPKTVQQSTEAVIG